MSDYTPTTEEVRDEYSFHCEGWCERCNESDGVSYLFHEAEFDRWLAEVKAQERERIIALLEANIEDDEDQYRLGWAFTLINGEEQ